MVGPVWAESGDPGCREKLRRQAVSRPYPKPTLVVQVENTKAIERILVKELRQITPVPSV